MRQMLLPQLSAAGSAAIRQMAAASRALNKSGCVAGRQLLSSRYSLPAKMFPRFRFLCEGLRDS